MGEAIVSVWEVLITFLTSLFPKVTTFFYVTPSEGVTGGLTFAGYMAVIMAGVSLILLVFNLIRSFLPMRG